MKITQMPTVHEISNAIKNGMRLGFPNRLFLIDPEKDGNFRWRVGFNYKGARRELGVGFYSDTSPDLAMQRACVIHAQVTAGLDPSSERKKARKNASDHCYDESARRFEVIHPQSFHSVAVRWVEDPLRNICEKTRKGDRGRIFNHLMPLLGTKLLAEIQAKDIYQVCESLIVKKKIDTAGRVAKLCSNVFNYANLLGYEVNNPCGVVIESIPKPRKKHFPALTNPAHLAEILPKIYAYNGTPVVSAALKLVAMLMVRPGSLRMAEWNEFDLSRGLWLIPATKMKSLQDDKVSREPHVVPLPWQAVDILRELYILTGRSGRVFSGQAKRNKFISDGTINKALRSVGVSTKFQQTGHGFRAVARTMLREQLGFAAELIELQLDHAVKDANGRAYNRAELIRERQRMMQEWADYLDGLRLGKVEYDDPLAGFTPITVSGSISINSRFPEIFNEPSEKCVPILDSEREWWFKRSLLPFDQVFV